MCIGNGLFYIPPNTHIKTLFLKEAFLIQYLSMLDATEANVEDICLTNTTVSNALDCFDTCKLDQCLASFANCPKNCFNVVKNRRAAANARFTMRALGNNKYQWGISSLVPAGIPAHEEILWNCGYGYIYPDIE